MPQIGRAMETQPKIDLSQRGAQAALARHLKLTRAAVSEWFKQGNRVPAERVPEVERLTGISRQKLRPDLWPPEGSTNGG